MDPGGLVERAEELAAVDTVVNAICTGAGGVLVVEGPAGIGKTALLDEARRRAKERGIAVVAAQGAVLEHDFAFGAVRQLLEPALTGVPIGDRAELLVGAAALAAPVVAPDLALDSPPSPQQAVLHGLYWLVANLAERAPMLVVVDDVHWCDPSSLQFLAYLSRRIDDMPVGLIAALRTGDPHSEDSIVRELLAGPGVRVIRPSPLSDDGVHQLVAIRLGEPDQQFVDACMRASGGVPFLVDELLRALHADGVEPSVVAAGRIDEMGPRTVAHATMLRLSRLHSQAASVARAIAVLDRQARLDRVAKLASVDVDDARDAIEALEGMEILAPGQLQFTHPLVRQAIYEDLSPTARADAHRRVATVLVGDDAPVDEVATHMLLSDPEGRADVVATLRAAARQALARGAPGSAVAYLRRALAEGAAHGAEHAELVHELGSAEAFAWDPRAVDDLAQARQLVDDPVVRARVGWQLAEALLLSGAWGTAQTLIEESLEELGGRDPDLEAHIEGARFASQIYDADHSAEVDARMPYLRSLAEHGGPGARMLALILAVTDLYRCGDRAEARRLLELGLAGGQLFRDEGSESLALVQAVTGLVTLDDLDAADRASADVFDDAARRGSVMGYVAGCFYRTLIDGRRGRLQVTETYLRSLVEKCLEHGVTFAIPSGFWAGAEAVLERSSLADVAAVVESIELEPALQVTIAGAWTLMLRGRLRVQAGRSEEGIADLRTGGAIVDRAGFNNPMAVLWRSPLALALPVDGRDEAQALVAYELDRARATQLARPEGVALRAAGVLERGPSGIELLEESLRVLSAADAPLERARTLVELGAAMRRANDRVASREPLRAGLELAHICGAERLVARATDELHAAGARPRREAVSGPEALTSAEARVAGMAADGMTNKEIAQALFVTAKTVENQLGAVYRKLGVPSRDALRRALSPDQPN